MSCEGWEALILENVCDISSSKRIYAREYQDSGVPFYRGKEIIEKFKGNKISTKLFVSEKKFIDLEKKFGAPKQGDILLSSVGTLGVPYLVQNEKFYFKDGNLTWFKNFETNCDSRFVYWWLQSPAGQNQINNKAIGSTQKALTIDTLKKFDIQVPPLAEQKAIAATLSCLDDKIELNNQMNDTLEQMAQALFKSWFVDFEPFQDGEFEDSELGKIPKGWKVGTVEELTNNIFSGGTPRTAVAEYWGGEYSWFSSGETRNPIIIGTEKKITKSGIENSSTKLAKKGSVLIASAGQGFTRGQTSLAMVDTYVNQSVVVLDIMPEYSSYLFFNLRRRYEELRGISDSSSIRGSLTTKIIRQLPILIPTLEDVLEFKKIADTIIKNMGDIQFENSTLTSLRDTLLPKLMSGEIRVPVEPAE